MTNVLGRGAALAAMVASGGSMTAEPAIKASTDKCNSSIVFHNILLKYINSINKSSQIINKNDYIKIKSSRMTLLELKY